MSEVAQLSGLVLTVVDFVSPFRWRWRLVDDGGLFVADHEVALDTARWEVEAFRDLYQYLRWHVAPDQRLVREREVVAEVGDWVGSELLGPVGLALARKRMPVRLVLPPEAGAVGMLPWEVARVNGRVLAAHRVSVIVDQQPRLVLEKLPVGGRLRMLAIFSLPEGAGALNLRKERFELARLVNNLAKVNNKAVELRVVQYGVTRARLKEVLLEAEGWDVLHLSGHGLPGGLVLETDTGSHDLITSTELVDLLDPAADRIKLVTLSACESAAVTAKEQLDLLGLKAGDSDGTAGHGADLDGGTTLVLPVGLSSTAAALVERLDCAVLAMRFPVVDSFSVALAGSFYDLLLGKGQPIDRALALTVSEVVSTVAVPAVSVATPALFGGAAVNLHLLPPDGQPEVFLLERQRMAGFPPQPKRFVGRVGALARAAAVLAPSSGWSGLVFHGMAGAGKTTCALELAYTHQDSFPQGLVWWAAPAEGTDITTALTSFGLALEQQLGLKIVDKLVATESLRQVLPRLTELMEQQRWLVVVDNAESLLTDGGGWRDANWGLLLDALTAHQGLSRLVLTSRRVPAGRSAAVRVEAVHALSLAESMLLARELPNLARLLDGTDLPTGLSPGQARSLAARTLTVVQGHPKLIELADGLAADPHELAARLDDADRTWTEHGTQLDTFLTRGETTADVGDFASVLHQWTSTTTGLLDDPTRLFFQYLACVEPDDRLPFVVDANWPDLWRRLDRPGDPPPPKTLLPALVGQGLVEAVTDPETGKVVAYQVHPGVAEAVWDTAGPDLLAAADEELANYWMAMLRQGEQGDQGEQTRLVLRAARSAGPYLLRRQRWQDLYLACERLLIRDPGTAVASLVLPMLTTAVETNTDPVLALYLGATQAFALRRLDPDLAATRYRDLLETAIKAEYYPMASTLAGSLTNIYRSQGRLTDALTLADSKADFTRRAGHGPWSQLLDQSVRLQIRNIQGHHREVLDAGLELRDRMAALPDPPDSTDSTVNTFNVRESLLNVLMAAANHLGEHELALTLSAEALTSKRQRDATDVERAQALFNDYWSLVQLGRLNEARKLLISCRAIFEAADDIGMLGMTLSALAYVEGQLGHTRQAADLERASLRYAYLIQEPEPVAHSHHSLANHLQVVNADSRELAAHFTAAALISSLTGSGQLTGTLVALGRRLQADVNATPGSIAEVCATVNQVDGVHLQTLLDRLAPSAEQETLLNTILQAAAQQDQVSAERKADLIRSWDPALAALRATINGQDQAAAQALDTTLNECEQHQGWAALVHVLRRILSGERDRDALTAGLDQIDTTITGRAMDLLAGGDIGIDPDSWR